MGAPKNTLATVPRSVAVPLSSLAVCLVIAAACGAPSQEPPQPPPSPPPPPPPTVMPLGPEDAGAGAIDAGIVDAGAGPTACPAGMALVDTTYCPKVRLRCLREEYNKPNHITICHEFAPGQTCLTKLRRQRFCIDRYEHPNQEGAHPPVMVSWYDAAAACGAQNKRLCWQSEWESACEGPDKLPFPYGLSRDSAKCNIDNSYVKPFLDRVYSTKPEVHGPELLRLDQSAASGAKKGCVSGFGVHDLTGNLDEWVNSEENRGKSKWAGLKGGAWGHVRNACRPMTVSHPADFTYYFISFRCCADPTGDPGPGDAPLWKPPPQHAEMPRGFTPSKGWTTTERGPNRPNIAP